jgi:hypothetical protein
MDGERKCSISVTMAHSSGNSEELSYKAKRELQIRNIDKDWHSAARFVVKRKNRRHLDTQVQLLAPNDWQKENQPIKNAGKNSEKNLVFVLLTINRSQQQTIVQTIL